MKYELNGVSTPIGGISWNKTHSVKVNFLFCYFIWNQKEY